MMKYPFVAYILLAGCIAARAQAQQVLPPDKVYGDLFKQVQLQRVFPDVKTFVDCIPKHKPADM